MDLNKVYIMVFNYARDEKAIGVTAPQAGLRQRPVGMIVSHHLLMHKFDMPA